MKQLLDEKTLLELLTLAQQAEQQAKELCDLTAEIDEKWHIRLEPSPIRSTQTSVSQQ